MLEIRSTVLQLMMRIRSQEVKHEGNVRTAIKESVYVKGEMVKR
jgi:uncharacterized membrane protein YcaP (DUF421 family)